MLKATSKGIIEHRVLPPLTEEDKQTVAEIFEEYSALKFLGIEKRHGIWQPTRNLIDGLTISDIADFLDEIEE